MPDPNIVYTWRIERLDCEPFHGELVNVVRRVHWRLFANLIVSANTYGDVLLAPPSPQAFVPYNQLTQSIVIGWVEAAINARAAAMPEGEAGPGAEPSVAQLRQALATRLDAVALPPMVSMALPWP